MYLSRYSEMAENVELHIERSLPQLEQLERVGIFKSKEIK